MSYTKRPVIAVCTCSLRCAGAPEYRVGGRDYCEGFYLSAIAFLDMVRAREAKAGRS